MGEGTQRNQGDWVKQVNDTNQTPPGYLPTLEYYSGDEFSQGFQHGLKIQRVLFEADLKTNMDSNIGYYKKRFTKLKQ